MSQKADHIRRVVMANLRASPAKSAFLGVAFLVLVVMVVRQLSGGPASVSADPSMDAMFMMDMPPHEPVEQTAKRRAKPALPASLARNPFASDWMNRTVSLLSVDEPESGVDSEGELVLQCTLQGRMGLPALAVISGVVVYPGSKLDEYEVLSIGQRHAVLVHGEEELILKMR